MTEPEGLLAKHQALELVDQAQGLLGKAADSIRSVRGLELAIEGIAEERARLRHFWECLDQEEVMEEVDPRIPSNVEDFALALSAIVEGETDSVLVYAVYRDWLDANRGTAVSYQIDPNDDPVDELNRAVDEARAYLRVDEFHPMRIDLD